MAEEKKHSPIIQKLFLNEVGEVSLRKLGMVCATVGGYFVMGVIPGVLIVGIGKAILSLGTMFVGIGQFAKNDRKR